MPSELGIEYWWWGIVSYALCHLTHILFWHFKLLKPRLPLLVVIFFIIPGLCYLTGVFIGMPWAIAAVITHGLLAANYFAAYPAIQASSPTLVILDALYRNPEGLENGDLMALFSMGVVTDRVSDLEKAGLIKQEGSDYTLTFKGRSLANFFACYRKLLGYAPGTG